MIGNATTETPWLTPQESCNRLKVSQKTFKRHVAPRLKRKQKIGSLWRYHVEEIDQWEEDDRPTNSRSEAMECGTSSGPRPTGVVSIGPLELARAAIDSRFPCDGTTTKEYLHSNLEEAQAVLFPTRFFTSPGEAAPTTAELIAQATEMIGCGREDSNLHECYLTRSLV